LIVACLTLSHCAVLFFFLFLCTQRTNKLIKCVDRRKSYPQSLRSLSCFFFMCDAEDVERSSRVETVFSVSCYVRDTHVRRSSRVETVFSVSCYVHDTHEERSSRVETGFSVSFYVRCRRRGTLKPRGYTALTNKHIATHFSTFLSIAAVLIWSFNCCVKCPAVTSSSSPLCCRQRRRRRRWRRRR
jgi:hypothetical protein